MPENPSTPASDSPPPSATPPVSSLALVASADYFTHDKCSLFIAHSLALAIQDATDNLRHTETIATTTVGVALQRFLATGEPVYLQAIETAQRSVIQANETLASIAATATSVLRSIPTENPPPPPSAP